MTKNTLIASLALLATLSLLAGCSSSNSKVANADEANNSYWSKKTYQNKLTSWLHPYRIDVQQGNVITEEMRDNLKLGMSKEQVKHVLGTSVLSEAYSKDQWLYVYSDSVDGKVKKEQVMVLSFKDDSLKDIKENVVVN